MNLSTLRHIYIEPALMYLGHNISVTNRHVLGRLDTFSNSILQVRILHAEQESLVPTDDVQREVRIF